MRLPSRAAAWACSLAMAAIGAPSAIAAPTAYTTRAAFDAALAGLPAATVSTLDFDAFAAGTAITSAAELGGITFNYDYGGVRLQVNTGFSTTSGANFLGTDDGGVLQGGDNLALEFGASQAIGLYVISADGLIDGDIVLSAGGAAVDLLTADRQALLGDGSSVFFLGLVDSTGTFSTADITSACVGCFFFNIDDIVRTGSLPVPAPGTLSLLGAGLAGLALSRRRKPLSTPRIRPAPGSRSASAA